MSLFNDPGSCSASSNPLQNLGKHVSGDGSSLHRDRVGPNPQQAQFRSHRGQPEALARDFHAFSSPSGPEFFPPDHLQAPVPGPMAHHQQVPQHHQQLQRASSQTPEWANEFSKLSLSSQRPQTATPTVGVMGRAGSAQNWHEEFMRPSPLTTERSTPLSMYNADPSFARMTEHRQQHHHLAAQEAQQQAFADAFDQVQRELQENKAPEVMPQQVENNITQDGNENEDLSGVAKVIVDAMNDPSAGMSSRVSQKLKNSNFMALMQQLSEKEVMLEGEKFVDREGRDAMTMVNNRPRGQEQPEPQETEQREAPLPDPIEYLQQQQQKGKERVSEEPEKIEEDENLHYKISSFEYAQMFGPAGVAQRHNWEEDYSAMFAQ
uniref:ARAD1D35574p n=1 Tax=Blastobotrys adeninivorans TaxID=409370 RepID=A0A060TBY0_BLAAD